MNLLKYVLPVIAVCGFATSTLSAKDSNVFEINERDIQAVKQHLKTKRDMRLSDKHDDLNISGDIRFKYKHIEEEWDIAGTKIKFRGNDNTLDTLNPNRPRAGTNEIDIEFNLYFDYTAERTWAHTNLEFDNCAGISHECGSDNKCGSGSCNEICLKSAYFGYNILEEGSSRLDVEVGRWDMYSIFDSRVQFQHRFDGALVTYSNSIEDIGDAYARLGMFVIDSVGSNWGYAMEIGLVDIMDLGLHLKYSYTDYVKSADRKGLGYDSDPNFSPCVRAWTARISQFTAAYHFNPEFVNEDIKVYAALLVNHSAKKTGTPSDIGKENLAWYVGAMVGGIQGEGDWAIDFNYQCVEAQALPDFAVSGVGNGNVNGFCYHGLQVNTDAAGAVTGIAAGNTNYSGFQLEGAYALTDNLTVVADFEYSSEAEKKAISSASPYAQTATGWTRADDGIETSYVKYEIQFMYAF